MLSALMLLAALPTLQAEDARLVMVGNSYTAQNSLHLHVANALVGTVPVWTEVKVHPLTQGGATLDQHAAQTDGSNGDTPWRETLVTGPDAGSWDWVVLQDQSQVPGFPQSNSQWQASRDGALILDEIIQAGGAETVFLLTWGRRDGDSGNPSRYPDYLTMQDHLTEGYLAYAAACAADGSQPWIIPAGHAWRTIHQDLVDASQDPADGDTSFTALYSSDGSHPSPAGSYLAALTAAAALTGRSVAEVPTADGVDEDLAATLREAADRTVLDDPFGEFTYRWALDWTAWESPDDSSSDAQVIISDVITRPSVQLTSDAGAVGWVQLGAIHSGANQGAGRLWIGAGGALEVETLDVCEGDCSLALRGGNLAIAEGTVYDLDHSSGTLGVSGALALPNGYTLGEQASLSLRVAQADTPLINAGDAIVLLGTVVVELDDALAADAGEVLLMRGDGIEHADAEFLLPEGASLLERGDGDGTLLVMSLEGSVDRRVLDSGEDDPGRDCGCAAGRAQPPAWLALGAFLALAVPGRRRSS